MKAELALLFIMIISINSFPFLRKLADTEESCKNAGKDYQEGKAAQCKTGNTVFEVTAKSECVTGQWSDNSAGVCSGTASPAFTQDTCKGTPVYTEPVLNSPATCKAGDKNIESGAASQAACDEAVKWTDTKCNVDGISVENCAKDKTQVTWSDKVEECKIGNNVKFNVADSDACEAVTLNWEDNKCKVSEGYTCPTVTDDTFTVEGSVCYITSITNDVDCMTPEWKKISDGTCKAGTITLSNIKEKSECDSFEFEKSGSCSVSGLDKDKCVGKFTPADVKTKASCKLGNIELTDQIRLDFKSACETELVWQSGICTNVMVSKKDDCIASPSYTAAVQAKCVDKASSSNSFLSFKFALVLIACLLF